MKEIFINILLLFFLVIIQRCKSQQYITSNMVEIQGVSVVQYDPANSTTGDQTTLKTINFATKFTKAPKILLSYFQIDFQGQTVNFNLSVQSAQQSSAQIQIQKYAPTIIYGLFVNVFAVEDNDIQVQIISLAYSNGVSQTVSFIQYPVNGKQRKAVCYPIGYNYTDSGIATREYRLDVQNISQTQYTISIITSEVNYLKSISVNCLEFFVESIGAYSIVSDAQVLDFTDMTASSSANPSLVTFNISPNLKGTPDILLGFVGIKNNVNRNVRLSTFRQSYQNNQEQIEAFTWSDSQSYSVQVGYFQYMMYDCQKNDNKINFPLGKTCVSICPNGYYQTTHAGGSICSSCIKNCNKCPNDSTCIECAPRYDLVNNQCIPSSCSPQQYILNQKCYDTIPDNTYCDGNRVCTQCQITCKQCDITLSKCLSCLPYQYLYQGICSILKPSNTYCEYKSL